MAEWRISLILGLEPVIDLASIVLRRFGDRPTHPIWHHFCHFR